MSQILVILSFMLTYVMSHAEQPLVPGGLHSDNCLAALQTESTYFFTENPDTDFSNQGTGAEVTRTNLPVTEAPPATLYQQQSSRMHRVQVMHLDLPPPLKG